MDIKEFFYEGGIVRCVDHTESDVVIALCQEAGLRCPDSHDPYDDYHGVAVADNNGKPVDRLAFWRNGSSKWESGMPFDIWMERYGYPNSSPEVGDLL